MLSLYIRHNNDFLSHISIVLCQSKSSYYCAKRLIDVYLGYELVYELYFVMKNISTYMVEVHAMLNRLQYLSRITAADSWCWFGMAAKVIA